MMQKFVIHIGANKTGSTTFQRWLFSRLDSINYLGEDCEGYSKIKNVLKSLVVDDDLFFDREMAKDLFDRRFTRGESRINVFSDEDIMRSRNASQCAQRLANLMPGAKILMVIRNQFTAIPSWYANHGAYLRNVPSYYWRRYVSFEDWMAYCIQFINQSPLSGFFYKQHVDLWARYFGKDNINVLLFEELKSNNSSFLEQLSDIIDCDPEKARQLISGKRERKRYTLRMHKFHKLNSRFFRNISFKGSSLGDRLEKQLNKYLQRGRALDTFIPEEWNQEILRRYKDGNSALAREYQLPLKDYGYPVGEEIAGMEK